MASEITHVRLSHGGTDERHITEVMLATGLTFTREQIVDHIELKLEYFFTTGDGRKATVEAVRPSVGSPYIRTKADNTTKDNLLSLPRF